MKSDKQRIKNIIESAIFISGKPLNISEIQTTLRKNEIKVSKKEIISIIKTLQEDYKNRGINIKERNENYYEFTINEKYRKYSEHLAPEKELSRGILQTLSLIAFKSPVKQSTVVEIRGNRAYEQIKELHKKGFVNIQPEGHTNILTITKKFMDYFGIKNQKELIQLYEKKGITINTFSENNNINPIINNNKQKNKE